MAKQEMKVKEVKEQKSAIEIQMERETEKRLNAMKMEQSKMEFSAKQQQLAETAAKYMMKYGKDYYLTQILTSFLDVTIQMEDAIETLESINLAVQCVGEAMTCMDGILESYKMVLEGSMTTKYTLWQRWKAKRRLSRAIRNNVGRMQQICDSIVGSQRLAFEISTSLEKATMKMQRLIQKNNEKQQKKREKQSKSANAAANMPQSPSKGEEMIRKIIEESGQSYDDTPKGNSDPQPSAPESGSTSNDNSDIYF